MLLLQLLAINVASHGEEKIYGMTLSYGSFHFLIRVSEILSVKYNMVKLKCHLKEVMFPGSHFTYWSNWL